MPTDPPKSYTIDGTKNTQEAGGTGGFREGDDLTKGLKKTLGSYLSDLTKTAPTRNAYPINKTIEDAPSFNKPGENTPPFMVAGNSSNPAFIDDVAKDAEAYFNSLSQGDYGDGEDPFIGLINKALRAAEHGEKLAEITQTSDTKVQKKISQVLKNNRFSPGDDSPFIDAETQTKSEKMFGRTQKVFGKYYKDDGTKSKAVSYTEDDLKNIAFSLLLKASGRADTSQDPSALDESSIFNADADNAGFAALATVRVGNEKLGAHALETANAFNASTGKKLTRGSDSNTDIIDPELPANAGFFDFNTPGSSYGQMYNHLEHFAPFGAYSPSPMALLIPQFVTIAASTASVGLLFGLLLGIEQFGEDKLSAEDVLPLGASRQEVGNFDSNLLPTTVSIQRMLGIPTTEYSFLTSSLVGLVWFQVSALFGGAGLVTSVQRSVARDTITFMNTLQTAGAGGSPLNAIGIIIDSLLNSKFFRFTVVMASFGDKIQTTWKGAKAGLYNYGQSPGKENVDDLVNHPLNRIKKSRKRKNKKGLVWGAGSPGASSYILPSAFITAQFKGGDAEMGNSRHWLLSNASVNSKFAMPGQGDLPEGSRLPGWFVEDIENRLESEYVPFYFHDLRTNEIIAFHAFLKNISDAYAPTWSQQTGIGRVEPAQIYGGTTRTIGVDFVIASTSEDDFDEMWFKINKLTTLVYPQFSKGRTLSSGDHVKFTQPFSQVQTASPLIRIRLGDLLKSNYSKFSLARLFGLGQSSDDFNPDILNPQPTDVDYVNNYKVFNAFMEINDRVATEGYIVGDEVELKPGTLMSIAGVQYKGEWTSDFYEKGVVVAVIETPMKAGTDGADASAQVTSVELDAASDTIETIKSYKILLSSEAKDKINITANPILPELGYTTTLTAESIYGLSIEWGNLLAASMAGLVPNPLAALPGAAEKEFFSSENNAVVRSFESSRGRGLAGAITSMNFDWNQSTWETDIGSKAPKFCTVSIQFSPVHDITPGLDSDGFNRAPIYNAGRVMNGIAGDVYGSYRDMVTKMYEMGEEEL